MRTKTMSNGELSDARALVSFLAPVLLLCAPSFGQSGGGFDLTRTSVDGGGGTSSGAGFVLDGTVGQPDAGNMSGGGFTLWGGFRPAGGAAPPPIPTVSEWGLVIMTLLGLTAGTIVFARRRRAAAA